MTAGGLATETLWWDLNPSRSREQVSYTGEGRRSVKLWEHFDASKSTCGESRAAAEGLATGVMAQISPSGLHPLPSLPRRKQRREPVWTYRPRFRRTEQDGREHREVLAFSSLNLSVPFPDGRRAGRASSQDTGGSRGEGGGEEICMAPFFKKQIIRFREGEARSGHTASAEMHPDPRRSLGSAPPATAQKETPAASPGHTKPCPCPRV